MAKDIVGTRTAEALKRVQPDCSKALQAELNDALKAVAIDLGIPKKRFAHEALDDQLLSIAGLPVSKKGKSLDEYQKDRKGREFVLQVKKTSHNRAMRDFADLPRDEKFFKQAKYEVIIADSQMNTRVDEMLEMEQKSPFEVLGEGAENSILGSHLHNALEAYLLKHPMEGVFMQHEFDWGIVMYADSPEQVCTLLNEAVIKPVNPEYAVEAEDITKKTAKGAKR